MLKCDLSQLSGSARDSVIRRTGADFAEAMRAASSIILNVRSVGDKALLRYAVEYESYPGGPIKVAPSELGEAASRIPSDLLNALEFAKGRIEKFHRHQKMQPFEYRDSCGTFGQRVVPIERVGIYVPGGSAAYASSVLMACIPAIVAGVDEIALCTPGKGGRVADVVLASAAICGVDEVYSVGGAQSIAALAYGTESIRPVKKIVGPGGMYVTAAKLLVRNDCEIDFPAGPSEVLILADSAANPKMVAMEMLAQLEHDPLARAVLVSTSRNTLSATSTELSALISSAERREIVEQSSCSGAVFLYADSMKQAVGFANEYAPEHLFIDVKNGMRLLDGVRNAGSVLIGELSSVAFGDYCAGTNHILPTMGAASMRSALSAYDFLKVIPYQAISEAGASRLSGVTEVMARSEGLPAHADAARARARRSTR